MSHATETDRQNIARRFRRCPIRCPKYMSVVATLGDFFTVCHSLLEEGKVFWFRGHSRVEYRLAPSALRYTQPEDRDRALDLVADMRRFLEIKLARPPASEDRLGWMQVAQHYGLPTRLLDWTQNVAVALFFACFQDSDSDGLVAILNPIELNQRVDPKSPRVFNPQRDNAVIGPYFDLDGQVLRSGLRTIAINPTWNSERIALQQGVFTLHGSRQFELNGDQTSSLMYIPVLREHKRSLLNELHRVGIGEMFIFPEPEHVCAHLKRIAGLEVARG
jgi:hypothetical protein